jgi:hypothetical protein
MNYLLKYTKLSKDIINIIDFYNVNLENVLIPKRFDQMLDGIKNDKIFILNELTTLNKLRLHTLSELITDLNIWNTIILEIAKRNKNVEDEVKEKLSECVNELIFLYKLIGKNDLINNLGRYYYVYVNDLKSCLGCNSKIAIVITNMLNINYRRTVDLYKYLKKHNYDFRKYCN